MLGAPFAACVATMITAPLVIWYMRRLAVLDVANERTLHTVPTPRGGGAAVVVGIFSGVLVTVLSSGRASAPDLLPMTLAVALFGLIGLAEDVGGDIGGIAPLRRLAMQVLAALALTGVTVLSVAVSDTDPGLAMVVAAAVIGPLWVTAFVNAFNFMDGVNGISAVQATVAGVGFTLAGLVHDHEPLVAGGLVVAGAALGFAPFNLPRALVFLGDVGSYALGAAIAALALQAALSGVPVEAVVAPVVLYLADTATTLIRRIRAGERWYLPHRSHAYQRLATAGWSHTAVAGYTGMLATTCMALGLVSAAGAPVPVRACADLAILLLVVRYLGAPRRVAARLAATDAPAEQPSTDDATTDEPPAADTRAPADTRAAAEPRPAADADPTLPTPAPSPTPPAPPPAAAAAEGRVAVAVPAQRTSPDGPEPHVDADAGQPRRRGRRSRPAGPPGPPAAGPPGAPAARGGARPPGRGGWGAGGAGPPATPAVSHAVDHEALDGVRADAGGAR
ncbi:MAG: glycosyltransferase family 4 protein [Frankia sp.]|nr:glycosyltransferase family 4 protein [Frankia sp.]